MLANDYILWFFSTCAQTFGALVSVFGMFVLYRLQIEEGRVGNLRGRMVAYHESHAKLPFRSVLEELARREADHRTRNEKEHAAGIRAMLDDHGRIMVIATHNCDMGDGWEREGEDDGFFHEFSEKRAFPLGINIIFYAMTH